MSPLDDHRAADAPGTAPGQAATPSERLDHCTLPDGSALIVHALRRDDRALVEALFDDLGEDSRRDRFHGPKPRLTEKDLEAILDVGGARRAVLARDPSTGRPVALGELVRDPDEPRVAEIAFAVVDDWQGRGVGRLVGEALAHTALAHDVSAVRAFVRSGNARAASVVRRLGRLVASEVDGGVHELLVRLDVARRPCACAPSFEPALTGR